MRGLENDLTLIEIGIVSMVVQIGPVATKHHEDCLSAVTAVIRAAES